MKPIFVMIFIAATLQHTAAQDIHNPSANKKYYVSGDDGWDYLAVHPKNNLLYISHGTQVNIINKNTGDSVGIIHNTPGVHGIAFDLQNNKGFTSNGRANNVTVFDLRSNAVISEIPTGGNPDWIMYEPFTKMIITCNGRGKNLSLINPVTNLVVDSISIGGKPETAVTDGKGKLFVNVEDKNEIAVIDLNKRIVINRWSLSPGEEPTGLAIDAQTNRLFCGCDKKLIVLDSETGRQITIIPIGDGCDGVVFSRKLKTIYTANGEGTITVIHEENAVNYKLTSTIATQAGARTLALDDQGRMIFLPVAEREPRTDKKEWPKVIKGSFRVICIKI